VPSTNGEIVGNEEILAYKRAFSGTYHITGVQAKQAYNLG